MVSGLAMHGKPVTLSRRATHSHGGGVVRDSLVRDEQDGGGVAVARVPQLGVGPL